MAAGVPALAACDGADRHVRLLARATDAGRWHTAARQLLARPRWRDLLTWRRILWLVACLPALRFLVVGGFPATRGIQAAMTGTTGLWAITACLIINIGLAALSLPSLFRAQRQPREGPAQETRLQLASRLLCTIVAMVVGVAMIIRAILGTTPSAPLVANAHAIDALGTASFILGLALILAAFVFFPPGGAIMEVALAGGMTVPVLTETGIAFAGLAVKGAAFLAAGLLLMAAQPDLPTSSSQGSNSDTSSTGSSSTDQPVIPKESLDDLPANVQDAYARYQKGGWKGNTSGQTPGTKAGRTWGNKNAQLPTTDVQGNPLHYKEFDVNNKIQGLKRDMERFVRCDETGTVYYTSQHYNTLVEVIPS